MSEYKIVKLLTGEELLTEVTNTTNNTLTIKNPVRIVLMPNRVDPKTPSVGFAPWLEFSDEDSVVLDRAHIIAILTPIKQFVEQYRQMFSPIMVPGQQGLIIPGA